MRIDVPLEVTFSVAPGASSSKLAVVITMGSRPAYAIGVPSTTRLPELRSRGFERTEPRLPLSTSVSNPPSPPSAVPASEPVGAKTNVSSLSGAPRSDSTSVNETFAMLPAFAPVTDQVVSAAGP